MNGDSEDLLYNFLYIRRLPVHQRGDDTGEEPGFKHYICPGTHAAKTRP